MEYGNYKPSRWPKIIGLGLVSVAVLAALLFYFIGLKKNSSSSASSATPSVITASPNPTSSSASANTPAASSQAASPTGSFSATASYSVPRDTNSIGVTLTLKNGVISDVTTQDSYSSNESGRYIARFNSVVKSSVIGKTLAEAQVFQVSGSSETSSGFDDAVAKIAAKAGA